ncbi:MAG TPA: preprotein translocase subunit SecG [Coxiellaceae bacterium]|nr:preprotein translocase subunit SecG [Coxiellaceae bacterium]
MLQPILLILHVLVALSIVGLVLLQQGKGATAGANFGGGASNSMFGSQGAMPFLVKVTVILAVIFFVTSISLTHLAAKEKPAQSTVLDLPEQN